MSTGDYRIIDEVSTAHSARKPPWNPLALFFMTVLFAPVGAPLFALNWARLGQPEKRVLWLLVAIAVAILPIIAGFGLAFLGVRVESLPVDRQTARILVRAPVFVFAYLALNGQRPLFENEMARGARKSNSWPYWLLCLALGGLFFLSLQILTD